MRKTRMIAAIGFGILMLACSGCPLMLLSGAAYQVTGNKGQPADQAQKKNPPAPSASHTPSPSEIE
jgi:hypothetical protein